MSWGTSPPLPPPQTRPHRPLHGRITKPQADLIHRLVEVEDLLAVFEEVHLVSSTDQVTETYAQQPHQHAAFVQLVEEFPGDGHQRMVVGGIGDTALHGMGVEVGVAQLDGYTGR